MSCLVQERFGVERRIEPDCPGERGELFGVHGGAAACQAEGAGVREALRLDELPQLFAGHGENVGFRDGVRGVLLL